MEESNQNYSPEIFTRLIREGFEIVEHYAFAKRGLGVLTIREAKEDLTYWKEKMAEFYGELGWDSRLVEILNNN